jgi:hypothetical protein
MRRAAKLLKQRILYGIMRYHKSKANHNGFFDAVSECAREYNEGVQSGYACNLTYPKEWKHPFTCMSRFARARAIIAIFTRFQYTTVIPGLIGM